jgi:hypothetical protein
MARVAAKQASGDTQRSASVLELAQQHLERDEIDRAIELLSNHQDSSGAADALLGVAFFRAEKYAEAERHLRLSQDAGFAAGELLTLLERARANALSDVARAVPVPTSFAERAGLKRPETGLEGRKPRPTNGASPPSVLTAVGTVIGVKVGHLIGNLSEWFGRDNTRETVWTNWYQHPFVRSMLMLARRRERLNQEQIFAAYPAARGTGYFKTAEPPPEPVRWARTADGSYNDLADPLAGAAEVRFGFNTAPERTLGESGQRLLTPNPRTVSRELLARTSGFRPIPFLNLLAAPWIQFMNHDWVSYGDPSKAEPYRIPLDADDPVRQTLHQTHLIVHPTQPDPTAAAGEGISTHLNEVTSWWDGSQIYGSDAKTMESLRSHQGGKLLVDDATGNLPVLADGVEHTGFRRNWWLGLSMLHTLFVKEHNTICDALAVRYPHFDDNRLFDTARLINTAVLAKIHTVEWTPAVLPNQALNAAMNSNWYGFLTNLLRSKNERQTLAEINVADPIAGGLVGNTVDNHGVAYSLTREFLAVYRLHSLLPDTINVFNVNGSKQPSRTLALAETRQAASHKITKDTPFDDLFYSFGIQHPGQLVLNNYPDSLRNLSIPGAGFYDLAAVDVLRDRERGVPRYNQFRRLLGLTAVRSFEDITTDPESLVRLKRVYDSVEDIDLLVGNLAEQHRPTGFGFGETLFEIFILNASRRLQADRFFTDCYREEYYTALGLEWVDKASLKEVLLRHYPKLAATGLANVENAFEPWDVGALKPERHPLRQFDSTLKEADERQRRELART